MPERRLAMTILVPLDMSDLSLAAVPHAVRLAEALGEGLLLVTVPDADTRAVLEEFAEAEHTGPMEIIQTNLDGAAASIEEQIEVKTEVLGGTDPASSICDRLGQGDVSMAVLATHGRTGLARWRMGSVAEKVMRHSTVPVMVIPAPWRSEDA
jgi:nucleotide-binding universal stress UspA family protein